MRSQTCDWSCTGPVWLTVVCDSFWTHCLECLASEQALEQSPTSYRLPVLPYMVPGDPTQALEHSPTPHRLPVLPQHDPGVPLQARELSLAFFRLPALHYMVPGKPTPCRLPVLPFLVSGDPSQALEQSTTSCRLPVLPFLVSGDPTQCLASEQWDSDLLGWTWASVVDSQEVWDTEACEERVSTLVGLVQVFNAT